jgi:hypothetical protein
MMASDTGVTQIDSTYLTNLQNQLRDLHTQVEQQLTGMGTAGVTSTTTSFIEPITSTLHVAAGTASFDAGAALNSALSAMGGSVHDQLTWLGTVLNDMIGEITTTVSSFNGTESLNNETVDQLISDFQNTIGAINTPAASNSPGTGNTGTGNTGTGNTGTGNTGNTPT